MKIQKGQIAAITGAGSGIGRALALDLAQRGVHLALSDINTQGLEATAQQAQQYGVDVISTRLDVAQQDAVTRWANDTAAHFGKVHYVFNNAGVALGATVDGMKIEDFKWLMDINFWGVIYGTQAFLPHLKASGAGHIVNISSVFGLVGIPAQSAYNAAKFAVRGFTESLREELDMLNNGVSCTCVHPGGIKTNIAKAARTDSNMRSIGLNERSTEKFEKAFMTTPAKAASTILRGVESNARRVLIGPDAVAIDLMQRLLPTAYQKLVVQLTKRTA